MKLLIFLMYTYVHVQFIYGFDETYFEAFDAFRPLFSNYNDLIYCLYVLGIPSLWTSWVRKNYISTCGSNTSWL